MIPIFLFDGTSLKTETVIPLILMRVDYFNMNHVEVWKPGLHYLYVI